MQSTTPIHKINAEHESTKGSLLIYDDDIEFIDNDGKKSKRILVSAITSLDVKFGNSLEVRYEADTQKHLEYFDTDNAEDAQKLYKLLSKAKEEGSFKSDVVEAMFNCQPNQDHETKADTESTEKSALIVETINTGDKTKGIMLILMGLFIGIIFYVLGQLFSIVFRFGGYFIWFYTFFYGLRLISNAKKQVYRATCPYCKQAFYFPINKLNVKCPKCQKTVIIEDNEFKIVE